jgi:hypothetical protein
VPDLLRPELRSSFSRSDPGYKFLIPESGHRKEIGVFVSDKIGLPSSCDTKVILRLGYGLLRLVICDANDL